MTHKYYVLHCNDVQKRLSNFLNHFPIPAISYPRFRVASLKYSSQAPAFAVVKQFRKHLRSCNYFVYLHTQLLWSSMELTDSVTLRRLA